MSQGINSFDWTGYMLIAEEQLAASRKEKEARQALQRSAISRAYYSAYNVATKFLKKKGHDVKISKDTHGTVRNYFERIYRNNVDYYLNKLHDARKRADYNEYYPELDDLLTEECVEDAKEVIRIINNSN